MALKVLLYVSALLVGLVLASSFVQCSIRVAGEELTKGSSDEELKCVFDHLVFMRVNNMQPSIDLAQHHCSDLMKLPKVELETPS